MVDLHRHDEFSLFDGFGKAMKLAKIAKDKGHSSFGTSNHGTGSGIAETYYACKEVGIKPILGVEVYFQPKFNKEKPSNERYHLCLYAMNLVGYQNLNKILSYSNLKQKYYKPIVDFELLERFSEGLICTTACIAGFISKHIWKDKEELARKALVRFKKIFDDNLYIEIQPYTISEVGAQEKVNRRLLELSKEYGIKCILTSDSHYGNKEDYDTYKKMHEMVKHDIRDTYKERYIPTEEELVQRFVDMHGNEKVARRMIRNLEEIEDKVEADILGQLPLKLPKMHEEESSKILKQHIKDGLKAKGKYTKKYIERCKTEFEVISYHGFEDYFLIVEDYVKWAKNKGIAVGPGRGSVCNSLVAYALDITKVDSIYFDLDFNRFMRFDKKKLPDIDLDFETDRRQEVIDYILKTYKNKSAQICTLGLYKEDNLLNDLFKVCGCTEVNDQKAIKKFVKNNVIENSFNYEEVKQKAECRMYDKQYENIIKHFSKMYRKVRYMGTHAAGVAITGDNLLNYTSIENRKGKVSTAYDLGNLELINVIKFDMLGLRTLSITKELEELTGEEFSYDWLEDEAIYERFNKGETEGIFQFETPGSQDILRVIDSDCLNDVIAASALNRPGPLSLHMPEKYGDNKKNLELVQESPWFQYTKETYGTIVYQEQIIQICLGVAKLDYADADKMLKMLKGNGRDIKFRDKEEALLREKFLKGAKENGFSKEQANEIFDNVIVYSFNKGHATGYTLISIDQMYYKTYYPEMFWYVTLKYAPHEDALHRFKIKAVKEGNIILLPHVNYKAMFSIQKVEGQNTLAEGLINIKNVGEKAALAIETERAVGGRFTSLDNFLDRVPKRVVNARVVRALQENGALEFSKKVYFDRVKKYNSTLYMKGM